LLLLLLLLVLFIPLMPEMDILLGEKGKPPPITVRGAALLPPLLLVGSSYLALFFGLELLGSISKRTGRVWASLLTNCLNSMEGAGFGG